MAIKFWVYDVPDLLKIEPKQVCESFLQKNENVTIQKFTFQRSP